MVVDPAWYVDSGATNHVTNQLGRMQAATEYLGNQKLTVGSGQRFAHSTYWSFFFMYVK